MQPRSLTLPRAAVLLSVFGLVAACSSPGASTGPTTAGNATTPASGAPATAAPPTMVPTDTPPDQVTGELSVLEWPGYEVADFYPDFAAKYKNVKLSFEFGASDAEQYGHMKAGSQADVFHPYTGWLQFYVDEGMAAEIDTSKLKNWDKVPEAFKAIGQIGGKQYFVPWDWGFSSILYNTEKIPSVDSWNVLLDPAYDGHISMWDDGPAAVTVSSYIHGYDETAITAEQLTAIQAEWTAQAGLNKTYWVAPADLETLVNSGEVWAGYSWQGSYAITKGAGTAVAYANPKEGRNSWVGVYGIRKDSPNYDLALRFLDEKLGLLTGQNLVNLYYYGSANQDVMSGLADPAQAEAYGGEETQALLNETFGLDDPAVLQSTNFTPNLTAEQRDAWTAMWTEVKASQ
jgi:spermidine/putrescine transport system substrate-binding protein